MCFSSKCIRHVLAGKLLVYLLTIMNDDCIAVGCACTCDILTETLN